MPTMHFAKAADFLESMADEYPHKTIRPIDSPDPFQVDREIKFSGPWICGNTNGHTEWRFKEERDLYLFLETYPENF